MIRTKKNWIAFGCALMYLVCFLFLPFYSIVTFGLSGSMLMMLGYAVMYIPLILAILSATASVVFSQMVSIVVDAVTLVATLVMLIAGRSVIMSGNALVALGSNLVSQQAGANVTQYIPVSAGIGCILCLILAVAMIVVEVIFGADVSRVEPSPDPFIEEYW